MAVHAPLPPLTIIGPGAVGSLLAARLAGHYRLTLVARDQAGCQRLQASGITLEEDGKRTTVHPRVVQPGTPVPPAPVLLTVKATDVAGALTVHRQLLDATPLVVGFQNGIAHLEPLQAAVGRRAAAAVTTMGANIPAPGRVRAAGRGETVMGFLAPGGDTQGLASLAAALTAAGCPCRVTGDIRTAVWTKLLVNVGINALTGILDCANGGLLADPWARQTMAGAVAEAVAVAQATGIQPPEDILDRVHQVCRDTRANISSLLQDLRRGRRTEIDAINGAVVRLGERYGIPTPVNHMLTQRIHDLETAVGRESP